MKARTARAMVSPIASWKPTRNKSFALKNTHCAMVTFIVYLGLRSLYRYSSGFCIPWSKRCGPFHDELLSSLSEWWWCTFWSYRDNEMDIYIISVLHYISIAFYVTGNFCLVTNLTTNKATFFVKSILFHLFHSSLEITEIYCHTV